MARKLIVELVGKSDQFSKSLDDATKKAESFGKKAGALGSKLTKTLTLPILGAGVGAFKMASDLNEAISAADVRFGKNARVVQDWAKNLDSAFGLTRREALDMVSQLRAVTQNSKLTDDQMLRLAERAADVGSQFNVASSEVGDRFRSALTGSSEVLERFGVNTKVGSQGMADFAASIGKAVKDLTDAEKQQAIYNIIMKETALTQGDATKTADTAAGQMRVLKADFGRAAEEIGQKLIPAVTGLMGKLSGMVGWLDTTGVGADKALIALLALAAAGPVLKAVELATKAAAGAQWLFNAAVSANPYVLGITALVAMAVATKLAWDRIDGFREAVLATVGAIAGLWRTIRNVPVIPGILGGAFNVASKLPFFHTGGVVPGIPGANVPIMAQAGERVIPRGGAGGGITIIVQGSVITERDLGRVVADAVRDNRLIGVT